MEGCVCTHTASRGLDEAGIRDAELERGCADIGRARGSESDRPRSVPRPLSSWTLSDPPTDLNGPTGVRSARCVAAARIERHGLPEVRSPSLIVVAIRLRRAVAPKGVHDFIAL